MKFSKKVKNLNFSLDKYMLCAIIRRVKDIEKQLKQAIMKSKMTRYRIAKKSGLTESQLSYFVNNQRTLTLPAAAKLAKVLELELKPKKKRGKLIAFEFGRKNTKVVIGKKKKAR
jgi:transcriptional regulator with XRE-family HTH domain